MTFHWQFFPAMALLGRQAANTEQPISAIYCHPPGSKHPGRAAHRRDVPLDNHSDNGFVGTALEQRPPLIACQCRGGPLSRARVTSYGRLSPPRRRSRIALIHAARVPRAGHLFLASRGVACQAHHGLLALSTSIRRCGRNIFAVFPFEGNLVECACELRSGVFPCPECLASGKTWKSLEILNFLEDVAYLELFSSLILRNEEATTRLPPRRTGFDSRRGRPWIFACGYRAGRCRFSAADFLEDLPFPPPFPALLLTSPQFTLIGSQDLAVKRRPDLSTLSSSGPSLIRAKALNWLAMFSSCSVYTHGTEAATFTFYWWGGSIQVAIVVSLIFANLELLVTSRLQAIRTSYLFRILNVLLSSSSCFSIRCEAIRGYMIAMETVTKDKITKEQKADCHLASTSVVVLRVTNVCSGEQSRNLTILHVRNISLRSPTPESTTIDKRIYVPKQTKGRIRIDQTETIETAIISVFLTRRSFESSLVLQPVDNLSGGGMCGISQKITFLLNTLSLELVTQRIKNYFRSTVTSHISEALLKFYFLDVPPPDTNKAYLSLEIHGHEMVWWFLRRGRTPLADWQREALGTGIVPDWLLRAAKGYVLAALPAAIEGEVTYGAAPEYKGGWKREILEKTRRPAASSSTIPTCENVITPPRITLGSPLWKMSSLSTTLPRPHHIGGMCGWLMNTQCLIAIAIAITEGDSSEVAYALRALLPVNGFISATPDLGSTPHPTPLATSGARLPVCRRSRGLRSRPTQCCQFSGFPSYSRLDCSPPTKANRVQPLAASLPDFRKWESCRAMPLVGEFTREFPVSPALHSGAAPFSPRFTLIGSQDLILGARSMNHELPSSLGRLKCIPTTHKRAARDSFHASCGVTCRTTFYWRKCKLASHTAQHGANTRLTLQHFMTRHWLTATQRDVGSYPTVSRRDAAELRRRVSVLMIACDPLTSPLREQDVRRDLAMITPERRRRRLNSVPCWPYTLDQILSTLYVRVLLAGRQSSVGARRLFSAQQTAAYTANYSRTRHQNSATCQPHVGTLGQSGAQPIETLCAARSSKSDRKARSLSPAKLFFEWPTSKELPRHFASDSFPQSRRLVPLFTAHKLADALSQIVAVVPRHSGIAQLSLEVARDAKLSPQRPAGGIFTSGRVPSRTFSAIQICSGKDNGDDDDSPA
ncbi:hypothetical protein PR048_000684 [Dryococelus australis]|uniref:Uncharacterized protein n=1 Tax=Dryococelus australis TaxID=614101 RepID=A0ABQ9IFB4_9NEOP|nr:hypothetical protein PR048_000684 [Dryococelus australis]